MFTQALFSLRNRTHLARNNLSSLINPISNSFQNTQLLIQSQRQFSNYEEQSVESIIEKPLKRNNTRDGINSNPLKPTTLKDDIYTISIIGRPNVGKSTLFNRLMGKKLALVDKMPGLTRDRREGLTQLFDIPIRLVDTEKPEQPVFLITEMFPHISEPDEYGNVKEPIFISAEHGDGLPDLYQQIKIRIPSTHLSNYHDKQKKRLERFNEYKSMLLDEFVDSKAKIVDVSDEENEGNEGGNDIKGQRDMNAFISHLRQMQKHNQSIQNNNTLLFDWNKEFDRLNPNPEDNSDFDSDNDINPLDTLTPAGKYMSSRQLQISSDNLMKKKPIQLSIVGRPNVGKSTLINGLLKENRVIANDLAGTTRDSVTIQWVHGGRRINLVDTAGVKLGNSIKTEIEQMVKEQVQQSIDYSHVVVVLIDSMQAFTNHDMMIIKQVLEEGRAVVIAANKWDLVEDKYKKKALKWIEKQLEKGIGQAKGIPIAYISAKNGQRVDRIMDEVMRVYEKWNTRVSTALLNKWIHAFQRVQKMPTDEGKTLKLRFLMQIKTRPPTFFLYVNNRSLIDDTFERFLRNSISNEFGFQGCPMRILVRDNKLQYARRGLASLNPTTRAVLHRIETEKNKKKNVTYRRRLAGNKFLYK